ncbi:MAG: glycosyltransferase [Treponema sp.]|nr:glycosyltransferase [Treponema sp.]
MTIAMFTDAYWPRINGVTVSIDAYSHALMRAGHTVVIVCSSYPETMHIKSISVYEEAETRKPVVIQVPSLPCALSNEDRIAQIHKMVWISRQVESYRPDIIHIHSEFVIAEFGYQYAKRHNIPVVHTFHTLWEEYIGNYLPVFPVPLLKFIARRILTFALKRADVIIVPTVQVEEVLKKYKLKNELCLLPTGIEPDYFNHNELQIAEFRGIMERMYPPLRDKRILLFAGRVTKEKNIDFLLRILPVVIEKHPEAVLLIVGNGPHLSELQKECERLNLKDHCVFAGYLERKDLALTYAISDVFVFPSLTETQGLVTIESMCAGTPVVAIGSMGTVMVMDGDNGGFMVQHDEHEFTMRVLDLLEDSELYKRKVSEARLHAQHWLIDNLTIKLLQIYEKTMKRNEA